MPAGVEGFGASAGQMDGRGDVGGEGDFPPNDAGLLALPVAGDVPPDRRVRAGELVKLRGEGGAQVEGFPAGASRVDSGGAGGEPLLDAAEPVVVERVHPGVLEAFLGRPAVPALPHGRRAELDLVEPRRKIFPQHEVGGEVASSGFVEREEKNRRPDEARREMPASGREKPF